MSSDKMNKRALLVGPKAPLELETKAIHGAPPQGIVLKTHYAGICHSDVMIWENEVPLTYTDKYTFNGKSFTYPMILGHEISGEVYEIGNDVDTEKTGLRVGDRVAIFSWRGCRKCSLCAGNNDHLCGFGGKFQHGVSNIEGGYQGYVKVFNVKDVVKVPDNIPMTTAALLPCSGLTAYNAVTRVKEIVENFASLQGQATLLVIGAGGLGQWGIRFVRAFLSEKIKIVCADIAEEKVALGKQAGAHETIVWPIAASLSEKIAITKKAYPDGIQATMDFVNNPTTIGVAFDVTVKGGVLAQVGMFGGSAETVPLLNLSGNHVTINGVCTGSIAQLRDLFRLVSSANIPEPLVITVPIEDASSTLVKLSEGKVFGRAVIDFM